MKARLISGREARLEYGLMLRRRVAAVIGPEAASALLAGQAIEIDVTPEQNEQMQALMPEIARFVKRRAS